MSVDCVLQRMGSLHPKVIDLSLDRILRLLDALGRPQDRLPPTIHVAGTNGKGSLVAYLRAMAEAAGDRVHANTSPHLVRFNERIRLAGRLIEDDALIALLERVERVNDGRPITFFEITNAAAFLAFADTPADLVLLETGLGGRFDATNVVERPHLTAITPVSIDHVQYLGNTVAAIAFEKAGILKPGVPCVLGPQLPEALAVIAARAAELSAPLIRHGSDWQARADGDRLIYEDGQGRLDLPLPALPGAHQILNAGTAVACARHLPHLGAAAIARGLTTVEWPARLQRLRRGPLVDRLPDGAELWLDGGHNPAAGEILARYFAERGDTRPLHLIAGMLNTKDAGGFFAPLARIAAAAHTVAIPGEVNALSAEALAAQAAGAGLQVTAQPSVTAALDAILRDCAQPVVLICGSLYLAGRVLADNG